MISQLENAKYVIVGEPRVHNSLEDLVRFHKKVYNGHYDVMGVKVSTKWRNTSKRALM